MRSIVAADLMTPEVLTVGQDLTIPELATFLLDNAVTGAVVENDAGEPIGVVSLTDIAAAAESGSSLVYGADRTGFYLGSPSATPAQGENAPIPKESESLRVRDVMTPQIYSVPASAPVGQVAKTLLDLHLHRVLVTEKELLVGIISTSDLLGLLIDLDD